MNYYAKNRERVLAYVKKWAEENPEKYKEMRKRAIKKHAPKAAINKRIWNEKNRKRVNELARINYRKNWEARRLSLTASKHKRRAQAGEMNVQILRAVHTRNIEKFSQLTCELCLTPIDNLRKSIEHFKPLSKGGTNELSNLGIAHLSCNIRKNNKSVEEFRGSIYVC